MTTTHMAVESARFWWMRFLYCVLGQPGATLMAGATLENALPGKGSEPDDPKSWPSERYISGRHGLPGHVVTQPICYQSFLKPARAKLAARAHCFTYLVIRLGWSGLVWEVRRLAGKRGSISSHLPVRCCGIADAWPKTYSG